MMIRDLTIVCICLVIQIFPSPGYGQHHDTLDLRSATFSRLIFSGEELDTIIRSHSVELISDEVRITHETIFNEAIVFKKADFSNLTFARTSFYKTIFEDSADFSLDSFLMSANFLFATFKKEADFSLTIFKAKADFAGVKFNSANFANAEFKKEVNFNYAEFDKKANFTNLKPDTFTLSFNHTNLPDTIDFSYNPILKNDVVLILASFPEDSSESSSGIWGNYWRPGKYDTLNKHFHYINLYNSDRSKFGLDYDHFRLYFYDIGANNVAIGDRKPEAVELSKDKIAAIYESLLKNFKDRGQAESYQKLDIEYRFFQAGTGSWDRFIKGYVPDWWWRFGYEKGRVFIHIFIFLFVFTFFTYWMIGYLHFNVYTLDAISNKEKERKSAFQKKLFSSKRLWYSIVFTFVIFFTFALKLDNLRFKSSFRGILGTLYVILVSAVGLLCLGYMANFIIQK